MLSVAPRLSEVNTGRAKRDREMNSVVETSHDGWFFGGERRF